MNCLTTLLAICCLTVTAKARPGYDHQGAHNLGGVPDTRDYSILKYPKYNILELGEYSKGHLPGDEIYVNKHVIEHVPEPYPVKVPVPQPYPVHIEKPYPVVETKYVKVPHAVPYEIVKQVPIPVEVPKPYPVPVDSDFKGDSYHAGSQQSFGIQNYHDGLENAGGEVQHLNSVGSQGDGGYQVSQEGEEY